MRYKNMSKTLTAICILIIIFSAAVIRFLVVKNDKTIKPNIYAVDIKNLVSKTISSSYKNTKLSLPQVETVSIPVNTEITTIDQVFENNKNIYKTPDLFSIAVTGDVMLSRRVNEISEERKDYTWMFKDTKDFLISADLTLINLESPIAKNCNLFNAGMVFCAREQNIQGLNFAGIDVASVANNHALDQKAEGLVNTVSLLQQNAILPIGNINPVYKQVKNSKIAFVAYTELSCNSKYLGCLDTQKIAKDIKIAKENSDLVIAFFHWGTEYTTNVTTIQKRYAKLSIDNGADIVLGSHPHWIQPIEFYNGKMIVYSMGNFVFDQMWSTETRQGLALKLYIDKNKVIKVDLNPLLIEEYGKPKLLEEPAKHILIDKIKKMSTK